MAKQLLREIAAPIERIDHRPDEFAIRIDFARHRVDGQIAAREILLQRHIRRIVELEAVIPRHRLTLRARERVFLMCLRMQEHRKILAHRTITLRDHLLWRRADDHIIAIDDRHAQQFVTDRAADGVNVHHAISFFASSIHSATAGNAQMRSM